MSYLTRLHAAPAISALAAVAACLLVAGCTSAAPTPVAGTSLTTSPVVPAPSTAASPASATPTPSLSLSAPPSPSPSATTTPTPMPTGNASTRLAALASRAPATLSATYELMASGSTTVAHITIDITPGGYRVSVTRKGVTAVLIVRQGGDSVSCSAGKCFTVAVNGDGVPTSFDPQVQHVITDDLAIFAASPDELTVTAAPALGVAACFTVKPSGTGPTPVVAGHYCLDNAGHIVSAVYPTGTLSLASINRVPDASVLHPPSAPRPIVTTSPPQPID